MLRSHRLLPHLAVAALFLGLAVFWSWPLAFDLSAQVPGWPGDNFAFLWNSWWMRHALATGLDPWRTDLLFAPFGLDLTLHTHTALSSGIAATVFGALPLVTAHNVVILVTLALNGFAAYLLAWTRVRDRGAAIVAGLVFGGSPYISAHLIGHVNLLTAWALPFFAMLLLRAMERGSLVSAALAGAVVALTGFNDYYYVVYCAALAVSFSVWWLVRIRWIRRPARPRVVRLLGALLAVDAVLILFIVAVGGFDTTLLGVHIAANQPTNLLAFGWGFGILLLLEHWRPQLDWVRGAWSGVARTMLIVLATAAAGLSPLLIKAAVVVRAGDYVAPSPSWRSAPAGVDLVTLLLGNPWHGLLGPTVRGVYERLQLNAVEGVGWMGLAPVVLAGWVLLRRGDDPEVRLWRWAAAVFFVWALGPWLHAAGVNVGLLLPQNVLAHVPIVSNARMPGRAMVVVFMALAMLVALALAALKKHGRGVWPPIAAVAILCDFWPAPFLMTRVDVPPVYATLRDLPPGIVCELPVGLRDGIRSAGAFDDQVLAHQMVHAHPMVGGFAARLPASIYDAYAAMPVVRSLLLLSSGKPADAADTALTPLEAGASLRQAGIRYFVVNRETAPPPLREFVERTVALRLVTQDGSRALYEVPAAAEPGASTGEVPR